MVAAVEVKETQVNQKVDCQACLTRNCPLNGKQDSPVTSCSTFRLVNCAFCATKDCPLNGTINSPVLNCNSFKILGSN